MQSTNFEYGSPYLTIHHIIILFVSVHCRDSFASLFCSFGQSVKSLRFLVKSDCVVEQGLYMQCSAVHVNGYSCK